MGIIVTENKVFALQTKNTTYAFFLDNDGILVHLYWGKRINDLSDFDIRTMEGEQGYHPNIDKKQEEFSSYGMMRYKETSLKISFADGVRDFRYALKNVEVLEEKMKLTLEDVHYGLQIILHYRVYEEDDIIERWSEAHNIGTQPIIIERFHSAEFSLYGTGYQSINCNGTWADEFKPYTDTLNAGKKVYESLRGSVAHVACPYFILHQNASETSGDVYYGVLAYSGNFKVVEEPTPYGYLNVLIGISDTDFEWKLQMNERFETPHVYAGYSADGFGEMSNRLADFSRKNVMPKSLAKKPLKVLYNSWEATTFDVSCEKQIKLAEKAAQIGSELFVVDDGWFGQRSSDHLGLGDWYVNPEKFPQGLKPLIDRVYELGMDFGLWIEPEMVNENSDLYRKHPDWIYRYKTREVLEGRYQYMLDLTNPEVVEFIINFIDRLLCENEISYIKWDMNRALGECGSAYQSPEEFKAIWVKHIEGFYTIIRTLRKKHPSVEFEACASGGGRVDYGCMQYFDEFWTSDNTDPLVRLSIQETYSLVYPIKYMRAWVTDAANNEYRKVPLNFKLHTSMCGALGIGMDLNQATKEELMELSNGISFYKEIREIIQFGKLHRLKSCHRDDFHAVQYNGIDTSVLFAFLLQQKRGKEEYLCKLRGLDETARYTYEIEGKLETKSGEYLMNHGLKLHMHGDYRSLCSVFKKID